LHTMYLLVIPLVFLIFSVYALTKRMLGWKLIAAVFCIAFFLNIPQFVSEYHSGWHNTHEFISGILQKPKGEKTFLGSLGSTLAWQGQANVAFLAPYSNNDKLDYAIIGEKIKKDGLKDWTMYAALVGRFVLGTLLALIGYGLLGYFIKKEPDQQKKNFLVLVALHITVTFLILIAIAHDQGLVLRYLLILELVPFVLLGFLLKFLRNTCGRWALACSLVVVFALIAANVYALQNYFQFMQINKGDFQNTTLGEELFLSRFIIANTHAGQRIYFVNADVDENKTLEHIIAPLYYFTDQADIQTSKHYIFSRDTYKSVPNAAYFTLFINNDREAADFAKLPTQTFTITDSQSLGFLTIFKLELQ